MDTNASSMNMLMDWNDTIENDGQQFITLPEGDFNFIVSGFERGRFNGSTKIPPCNKATLTLSVETAEGTASVRTDLILYRSLEWKIAGFFRAIGQKKHGERVVMDWNKVLGARGRAHFKPRTYLYNGAERTANDVDYFIDYDEKYFSTPDWVHEAERATAQPMTQPVQTPQQMSWKDGQF